MSLRPARRCVSLASCMMLAKPIFVPTGRVAKRKQGSTMQAKNSQGAKRIAASALNPLALPAIRRSRMLRRRRFELAQKRANLDERLEGMISRVGQLRQILSDGERASELDLLKTQRAQIITRQTDSAHELVRLLLAKRMVSGAIEAWGTEPAQGMSGRRISWNS